jgi:hypothetical protein
MPAKIAAAADDDEDQKIDPKRIQGAVWLVSFIPLYQLLHHHHP